MKKETCVGGAFIADDIILTSVASADVDPSDIDFNTITEPTRIVSGPSLDDCIDIALREIYRAVSPDRSLKSVSIAIPGPILGCGVSSVQSEDILSALSHRKGPSWSDRDLRKLTRRLIHKHTSANEEFPIFRYRTDAGAYALGDYFLGKYAERIERGGCIGHIIIDEGVGGAFVSDGHIFPRYGHSEIGHLRMARHPNDGLDTTPCSAHSYPNCAESRISLRSLRARWRDPNVEDALRTWTPDDQRLEFLAFYIAQLCTQMILFASPSVILLSGRGSRNEHLAPMVNQLTRDAMTPRSTDVTYPGYIEQTSPEFIRRRENVNSGIIGCMVDALRLKGSSEIADLNEYRNQRNKSEDK